MVGTQSGELGPMEIQKNSEKLILEYLSNSQLILSSISISEVTKMVAEIERVRISNSIVYVVGNGGSASTASHFVTDIGVGSLRRANPVKAICLNDNVAVLSALANDLDYDSVFEQQVTLLAQPDDLLILISASGNSQNLIRATESARKIGTSVFSLTGFDGGKLRQITPGKNVHVQTDFGAYGLVEDAHLAICHVVTECLRAK